MTHRPRRGPLPRGLRSSASLLVCFVAWAAPAAAQIRGGAPGSLGRLPATFAGDLPCADCAGIRHQLELFPDRVFFLRMTYLGKGDDARVDDVGGWMIAGDGRTLLLFGRRDAPLKLAIEDAGTLRTLDRAGRAITSSLSYDLTRRTDLPPLEPRLRLRGMYRYLAGAGQFTECLTRRTWPAAQERDGAALEAGYTKARRRPGEPLLVTLEGQVAMRARVHGGGQQPTLVVEQLTGIWPGETCGARFTTEPLENTYWKLTRLGDVPVTVAPGQPEPHLVLGVEPPRVRGFGGCNRLTGSYERDGDRLTFRPMAGTMMTCPDGMDTEKAFLAALGRVSTLTITGQHLELYDAAGHLVARLEARHME